MSAGDLYQKAAKLQKFGTVLFGISTAITFSLIFARNTKYEIWLALPLVALAGLSLLISLRSRILINDGNGRLRSAQLADALSVSCEYPVGEGYYNSSLPSGIRRLLATTCESAGLTLEILEDMLTLQASKLVVFVVIFLFYLGYAKADVSVLAVGAQIIFSGELIASAVNLHRYLRKTRDVHKTLLQFFRTETSIDEGEALAVGLTAHVDYECAKEEAAVLLSSRLFKKKNPAYTARWNTDAEGV